MSGRLRSALTEVDWKCLRAAGSQTAESVPIALGKLADKDPDVANEGYQALSNLLGLHGLYESSLHVIPFLFGLLDGEAEGKPRKLIYDLLVQIAVAYDAEDSGAIPGSLRPACRGLLSDGLDLYLRELENRNSNCRSDAAEMLEELEELDLSPVKGRLKEILDAEEERIVREVLMEKLLRMD